MTARVHLTLLFCVHKLLVASKGVDGYSHFTLTHVHPAWFRGAITRVAQLAIGQNFGILGEVGRGTVSYRVLSVLSSLFRCRLQLEYGVLIFELNRIEALKLLPQQRTLRIVASGGYWVILIV